MDISIIIVNYNTRSLLQDCLKSVYNYTKDISFEVIVSDNGSTDGSIEMLKSEFPQVILIENNANLGFGTANNRALDIAKGKYIFYLNSDTVLLNNACKIFYDYFEEHQNENLGAIGANLLDAEKLVIHSYGSFGGYKKNLFQLYKQFITNLGLTFFYIFHIPTSKFVKSPKSKFFTGEVDYITGADLFMLNNEDARFDESFFLYFEETDLQKRLADKNKKRIIIDGPQIQHLCGGSVGADFNIKRKASLSRIHFELSRVYYLKKHFYKPILDFLIKLQITINWLNPFLIKNTSKFLRKLWKI